MSPALNFNAVTGEIDSPTVEDYRFSMFRSLADFAPQTITLAALHDMILSCRYQERVDKVRTATSKDGRDGAKKMLPAVTVSGVFSGGRQREQLVKHSGLVCLDFDLKDNPFFGTRLAEIQAMISGDQFSLLVFRSVGGAGLAVIARVEPERHIDAFLGLREYYRQEHGITAEEALKDVNRLRFISADPHAAMNNNARIFKRYSLASESGHTPAQQNSDNIPSPGPLTPTRQAEIESALAAVSPDDYHRWIMIGQALHSESDAALDIWDRWSARSEKYQAGDCARKWGSFGARGGVNIESLFKLAYDGGWTGPAPVENPFQPEAPKHTGYILPTIAGNTWVLTAEPERQPVIENVIDAGDMLGLIGQAKMRKSFFALQLALSCAAGGPFLRWNIPVAQKVLYLNFEISPDWMQRRVKGAARSMGLPARTLKNVEFANLRGLNLPQNVSTMDAITETVRAIEPTVMVVDPLYMLHDCDENNAQEMKPLVRRLMALMAEFRASVIYVHHDAKGKAGDRNIRDRGAGSNLLDRACDAKIVLTQHAKELSYTCVDMMTRNFPPVEGFVCDFDGAFRMVDADYLPETTVQSKRKTLSITELADQAQGYIQEGPEDLMSLAYFRDVVCMDKLGLSRRKAGEVIKHLVARGDIAKSRQHAGGYKIGYAVDIERFNRWVGHDSN